MPNIGFREMNSRHQLSWHVPVAVDNVTHAPPKKTNYIRISSPASAAAIIPEKIEFGLDDSARGVSNSTTYRKQVTLALVFD